MLGRIQAEEQDLEKMRAALGVRRTENQRMQEDPQALPAGLDPSWIAFWQEMQDDLEKEMKEHEGLLKQMELLRRLRAEVWQVRINHPGGERLTTENLQGYRRDGNNLARRR